MNFEWDQTDRYRSNDGAGPLTARILCVTNDEVLIERWHHRASKAKRFRLPLRFFLSPRCGWRKAGKGD